MRNQRSSDGRTGSLNCELTSVMIALIDSNFANISSWVPLSPPIMDDIWKDIISQDDVCYEQVGANLIDHGPKARA